MLVEESSPDGAVLRVGRRRAEGGVSSRRASRVVRRRRRHQSRALATAEVVEMLSTQLVLLAALVVPISLGLPFFGIGLNWLHSEYFEERDV